MPMVWRADREKDDGLFAGTNLREALSRSFEPIMVADGVIESAQCDITKESHVS